LTESPVLRSRRRSFGCGAALVLALIVTTPTRAGTQILELEPGSHASRVPQAFLDACFNMDAWPAVARSTTYLSAPSDVLASLPAGTLTSCFANLQRQGIKLTLGLGSVKSGCLPQRHCYYFNEWQLIYLRSLGAPVAALMMDEPLTAVDTDNAFGPNRRNLAFAVQATVDWMQLVRTNFPGWMIADLEAYPAIPSHRMIVWLTELTRECTARGVKCPEVFYLDHGIDQPGLQSPHDVQSIRDAVHSVGMQFGPIYTNTGLTANSTDDCHFTSAVVERMRWYNNGHPYPSDWYSIKTWDPIPAAIVPEVAAPTCPFMWTVRNLIDHKWIPQTGYRYDARLYPNQSWPSKSGTYRLTYRFDGNLVLYRSDGAAVWHSNTQGTQAGFAIMQRDGNLVVFDRSLRPVWWSGTSGHKAAYLVIENDGRLLIFDGATPIWASAPLRSTVERTISLVTHNGMLVVAENGGGSIVNANRIQAAPWEKFALVDCNGGALEDGDEVLLRARNGSYVRAEGGGVMLAARSDAPHAWATFTLVKVGGRGRIVNRDYVALQTATGRYWVARGGGGGAMSADRGRIGTWETFQLLID
jgi:hypothetical protein